jgi:hypothetical protein
MAFQADKLFHKEFKDVVPILDVQFLQPLNISDVDDILGRGRKLGALHQHLLLSCHDLLLLSDLSLFGFQLIPVLLLLVSEGVLDHGMIL